MYVVKVINKDNTSDIKLRYPFESWADYWKAFKGNLPNTCPRCGMPLTDPVGAHVNTTRLLDWETYIIPICRGCNKAKDIFTVDTNLLLKDNL